MSNSPYAFAISDGFHCAKTAEGQYVTVCYSDGLDEGELTQQLDIRPSDKVLAGQPLGTAESGGDELSAMLDTLYLQVSDVLDMHLYSLKPTVKICKTHEELTEIYEKLFRSGLGDRYSFYVYDFNSIYVSANHFQKRILSHEISHAIISRFFPLPAPVKVQEVLAMYVEYNLNN